MVVFEANLMTCWGKTAKNSNAKSSICQPGSWKGSRQSDVPKPQRSFAFPGTEQSVPALAAGFRKRSLVCCDSKLMALCHSCVSRGFQAAGRTFLGSIFSFSG